MPRYIDADALLSDIERTIGESGCESEIMDCVLDAPEVDVAPVVRGEWEVAIGYDPNKKVQCQNCYKMAYEPTPYCPNCGAKMDGAKEATP